MDLLHTGRFNGSCLVARKRLRAAGSRIHEQGFDVSGFGEQKTPGRSRQACKRFIYTENLVAAAVPVRRSLHYEAPRDGTSERQPFRTALYLIETVSGQIHDVDGRFSLRAIGHLLLNLSPTRSRGLTAAPIAKRW